jgi:hypothetical protein
LVAHFRAYNGFYNSIDGWLLVDGFDIVEVNMGLICNVCNKVKEHGVQVIKGEGAFIMVCDECYMDADEYMEEMRGCGCGGHCD